MASMARLVDGSITLRVHVSKHTISGWLEAAGLTDEKGTRRGQRLNGGRPFDGTRAGSERDKVLTNRTLVLETVGCRIPGSSCGESQPMVVYVGIR